MKLKYGDHCWEFKAAALAPYIILAMCFVSTLNSPVNVWGYMERRLRSVISGGLNNPLEILSRKLHVTCMMWGLIKKSIARSEQLSKLHRGLCVPVFNGMWRCGFSSGGFFFISGKIMIPWTENDRTITICGIGSAGVFSDELKSRLKLYVLSFWVIKNLLMV